MRLREHTGAVPKPMVTIGDRPILWHIMKYYAHYGHKDFVLCLGYKASVIKEFFLNYNEAVTNDFVLRRGGRNMELLSSDIHDWRITFLDTGLRANIGERLKAVQHYLAGEEVFLASYGDCLTDAPLSDFVDDFRARDKIASFVSVPPPYPLHFIEQREDGVVTSVESVRESPLWINGGYFILRQKVFDYIAAGEELVEEPFQRLIDKQLLITYPYRGFWAPMDTLRERQELEALAATGRPPWAIWRTARPPMSLAGRFG